MPKPISAESQGVMREKVRRTEGNMLIVYIDILHCYQEVWGDATRQMLLNAPSL